MSSSNTNAARLLHPEIFKRTLGFGPSAAKKLLARCREIYTQTQDVEHPEICVIIRTRNDGDRLESLFEDIEAQDYTGKVEVVVVDTESKDKTLEIARKHGAIIVEMQQKHFNYPKGLNLGFEAANHALVFSVVGHSSFTNNMTFRAVALWAQAEAFGGAYGATMPDKNASPSERFFAIFGMIGDRHRHPLAIVSNRLGLLQSNAAAVSKNAWKQVGGYDEKYGAGGEDNAMAVEMLAAGLQIVREPALSVHHTHGLGLLNLGRQQVYWNRISQKALPFSDKSLTAYRPDLRRKHSIKKAD